jgi:hypothetical protein
MKLKESELKAKKKLETEILTITESFINSKIQFQPVSVDDEDYRRKFLNNLTVQFDEKLLKHINLESIHTSW